MMPCLFLRLFVFHISRSKLCGRIGCNMGVGGVAGADPVFLCAGSYTCFHALMNSKHTEMHKRQQSTHTSHAGYTTGGHKVKGGGWYVDGNVDTQICSAS